MSVSLEGFAIFVLFFKPLFTPIHPPPPPPPHHLFHPLKLNPLWLPKGTEMVSWLSSRVSVVYFLFFYSVFQPAFSCAKDKDFYELLQSQGLVRIYASWWWRWTWSVSLDYVWVFIFEQYHLALFVKDVIWCKSSWYNVHSYLILLKLGYTFCHFHCICVEQEGAKLCVHCRFSSLCGLRSIASTTALK